MSGPPTLIEAALELAAAGWPVFPCDATKRPIVKDGYLSATTDPAIVRTLFSKPGAKLIGVPTGPASKVDVIDLDYRHGASEWEDANQHRLPETRVHQTQNAGRHLLLQHAPGVRNSAGRIAPGVDVRGAGGYIIVPPSPGYTVISDAPIVPWPEWLLVPGLALPKPKPAPPISSATSYVPTSDKRFEALRLKLLANVCNAPDGRKHERLRDNALALGGIAAHAGFSDEEAARWLMDALTGKDVADWKLAEKTALWALAAGRAKPIDELEDRPRSNGATHHFAPRGDGPAPPEPPDRLTEDDPGHPGPPGHPAAEPAPGKRKKNGADESLPQGWQQFLQRNADGHAVNNLANAMTALRLAPELRECFRFDEMLLVAVLVSPLPKGKPGILPRPARDTDVSIVQEWLQRNGLRRLGKDIVHQAVALRAEENAFHPIRDYLNGLRWDRKPRLSTWLTFYAGVKPDEKLSDEEKADQHQYISAIGRMFLISMVARVMRPGCKVDYMLILESIIQGEKKSTLGEVLAAQWFSDSLPNIGTDPVRVSQHLRGKWLIEISELSAMSKAKTEELKAFLTRKEEHFTPKYGRLEVTEPRQCTFMGTTNKATYLRDETGARRFWPAKAGVINITALTEDRDQLFAEAVHAYHSDEQWFPDRDFEKKFIMPQQEARRETDAWEQTIGDWLETPLSDKTQRTSCTVSEVAENALRMERGRLSRADQLRIMAALEILGWERGERTKHSRPWVRRTVAGP